MEASEVSLIEKADRSGQAYDIAGALFNATDQGVLGLSAAGVCLFANPTACRLLGCGTPHDLEGRDFGALIESPTRADLRTASQSPVWSALSGGRDVGGQDDVLWKADGSPLPVSLRTCPLHFTNGDRAGILLTFTDISGRLAAEQALRLSEARLRYIYESLRDGCVSIGLDGRFTDCNRRFLEITGYDVEEIHRLTFLDITPEKWRAKSVGILQGEVAAKGFSVPYEKEYIRADGTAVPVEIQVYARRDEAGTLTGYWATVRDITSRKHRQQQLEKLSCVVEQNPAIVVITDLDATIEYVNPQFEISSGYTAEEAIGRTPRILKSGLVPRETYEEMWKALSAGQAWHGELQNRRKDGSLFWEAARIYPLRNEFGEVTHYVAVKEDITERKEIERKLFQQTYYDPLTGLPNRAQALELLAERLDQAERSGERLGILIVNIDGFSRVNSEIGHEAGDHVLTEIARRLAGCCQDSLSLLARVGGDRFMVVIEGFPSSAALELAARSVLFTLRRPLDTGKGQQVALSGTIGIAMSPGDGSDVETLVKAAESAVQQARRIGRNLYRFHIGSSTQQRSLRMDLLLQGALERGELHLEYQPLFSADGTRCCGAEALIRWTSPELGRVSPGEFVPLFEDCELAHDIGGWILEEAVARCAEWRRRSGLDAFISINVSPRQLQRTDMVDAVAEILRRADLPPRTLKLEITERLFVEGRPEVLGVLEALDELGVILTLDDFGTGYSALGSLHKLPIRGLKIDRSFVEQVARDSREAAIVRSIQHLCDQLGIMTVAEGIETPEQAASLNDIGVGFLQGFLLSRPIVWERLVRGAYDPLQAEATRLRGNAS